MPEVKIIKSERFTAYRKKDLFRIYENDSQQEMCNYFPETSIIIITTPLPIMLRDLQNLLDFCHSINFKK